MTLHPNENEKIENCQILGFVEAKNCIEAKDLLLKDNPWIGEVGYSLSEIRVKQVLTKEQMQDIQTIVDYNWEDEEKHYEECDEPPKEHIFEVLKRLKQMYNT